MHDAGFQELSLGYCNQDPLENTFSMAKFMARARSKTPITPAFIQGLYPNLINLLLTRVFYYFNLVSGFKSLLLNKLTFTSALSTGNCKDDGSVLLLDKIAMLLDPKNKEILSSAELLLENMSEHNLLSNVGTPLIHSQIIEMTRGKISRII